MARESALDRIKKTLYSPGHDFRVTADYFGQVDIGRVSRELDLEELGKEKGSQNLPPATSTALDEVETQINDKLEALKNSANEQAENEALAYNSRIASLDFDGQFGRITQLGPEAIMEFKSEIKDQLNPLHIERNHLRELKNEVNYFRKENGLENKVAYTPPSWHQLIKALVIILIFVFETVMNGSFFAKGNEAGLFGGSIVAFTVTLVNIGFALILSLFLIRQLFHIKLWRKFVGLIALCLFLVFTFGLNLGVGHMREAGVELTPEMGAYVLRQLIDDPFTYKDAETWILVGIGLLFAFIAAIEGIYWNDPYPRYTFLQKRLDKQLDYYKETYEDCLIELNEVKSKNLGTFEDIGNDLTRRLAQLQKVVSEYSRLNNLYENFLTHLQTASDSLHAVYRDANIEARPKKAYPKRWKKAPLITKIKLTKLTQVDEKKLDKKIKDVRKDLKGLIVQIQEEFESGLDQFKGLDELGLEAESGFGEKEKA